MNSIIYGRNGEKTVEYAKGILNRGACRVYLIGIGGVSMSAVAKILLLRGNTVGGSDACESDTTRALRDDGAQINIGHSAENIRDFCPDICAYSLSISDDNKEYLYAKETGIPTLSRGELIGALCERYGTRIGVGGSHGKSTVCAMLYSALRGGGASSDLLFGADYFGEGAYVPGGDEAIVLEACEYGNSFLDFKCDIAVLLNLELDHTDFFKDIDALYDSFLKFASGAFRCAVLCYDDALLMKIKGCLACPCITFGKNLGADIRYEKKQGSAKEYSFYYKEKPLADLTLSVMGEHNAKNAAAALAVLCSLGMVNGGALRALSSFSGIGRRLERLGTLGEVDCFYDYAHHPTEIRASLCALMDEGYRQIGVVFRPHTYSRTQSLLPEFASALSLSHHAYIMEVFAAREEFTESVSSHMLVEKIREISGNASYLTPRECEEIIDVGSLDALVLMGAGDVSEVMRWLLSKKNFVNEDKRGWKQ